MENYWATKFVPPLAPSQGDVYLYQQFMLDGNTLLLGVTSQLIDLADKALDIDPFTVTDKVIKGDWLTNTYSATNIIGDGCFNLLTMDQCNQLVSMASKHSKRLIIRSFNYRLKEMKIAEHFPKKEDFDVSPNEWLEFEKYTFLIWKF
ncbi:hypothetical protein UFOVP46_7 [uncultured Caudovirales phage]|uniref:Uncharacterized protein n=1 Tax=uncultured Caudovirales phage TaxID=2100421 RepID=A0A6J5KQB2_9CAUD|nr:hypothetical protein UFOVP46_7 [uncultured Caudovirales phage]